ncbi:3D domain-containing protein [Psychromonas sp. SP041]|uniref:3D domain-containing protein n=1 Tax=Psychromonas sp. SP041 TaxID=1365007 RepID=UPI001F0EBF40|nr:3D domain-containing protein [Psychromonas sp. SP041]
MMKSNFHIGIVLTLMSFMGFAIAEQSLTVTASAYTSSIRETDSTPNEAAWGDKLKPGMKSIAVSRDLLKLGLTHQQEVRIKGFEGTFRVLDKMNKRWKKKIDIYMGKDVKKAREWGKQQVVIYWTNDK